MAEQREHSGDAPEKIGRITDEDVTDAADEDFDEADDDTDEDLEDEDDGRSAE
jgi:hypothetical protein